MADHSSLSQAGIFAKILEGSENDGFVGSEDFANQLTESLIPKAGTGRREIIETKDAHLVREASPAYKADFDSKMGLLKPENL